MQILNGLPWKRIEIILLFLRLHPSTAFQTLLLTMMATSFLLRHSCPPVHFSSLIPRMSMFTLVILFDHFQFALIHGPDTPGSYAILLFTATDLASITSHIHNWVFFLLWLHPFILSGVISPLISSSILGTYWPGEFLFQYPIILPFHTVHGVLKARILKWFAFSSPVDHILSDLSTMTCLSWVAPQAWLNFIELDKAVVLVWLDWLVFCDYGVVTHLEPDILECEVKWAL